MISQIYSKHIYSYFMIFSENLRFLRYLRETLSKHFQNKYPDHLDHKTHLSKNWYIKLHHLYF